jgi:hypothetical protein
MGETADVPRRPRISWPRRLWAVGPLVPAIGAFRCVNPSMSGDQSSIVEYAPSVPIALAVVATAWFAALALAGLVTKGRRGPGMLALVVVAGLGVPPAMCATGLSGRFGWRPYMEGDAGRVEARAADGSVWTVFCVTWLDGNYAFARTAGRGRCARGGTCRPSLPDWTASCGSFVPRPSTRRRASSSGTGAWR